MLLAVLFAVVFSFEILLYCSLYSGTNLLLEPASGPKLAEFAASTGAVSKKIFMENFYDVVPRHHKAGPRLGVASQDCGIVGGSSLGGLLTNGLA